MTKVIDKATEIELCTQDHVDGRQWMMERRLQITASRVGGISKMRQTTKKLIKLRVYCTVTLKGTRPHVNL